MNNDHRSNRTHLVNGTQSTRIKYASSRSAACLFPADLHASIYRSLVDKIEVGTLYFVAETVHAHVINYERMYAREDTHSPSCRVQQRRIVPEDLVSL